MRLCGAGSSVSIALGSKRGRVARACVDCAGRLHDQPGAAASPKPEQPPLFDAQVGKGRRPMRGWWEQ